MSFFFARFQKNLHRNLEFWHKTRTFVLVSGEHSPQSQKPPTMTQTQHVNAIEFAQELHIAKQTLSAKQRRKAQRCIKLADECDDWAAVEAVKKALQDALNGNFYDTRQIENVDTRADITNNLQTVETADAAVAQAMAEVAALIEDEEAFFGDTANMCLEGFQVSGQDIAFAEQDITIEDCTAQAAAKLEKTQAEDHDPAVLAAVAEIEAEQAEEEADNTPKVIQNAIEFAESLPAEKADAKTRKKARRYRRTIERWEGLDGHEAADAALDRLHAIIGSRRPQEA